MLLKTKNDNQYKQKQVDYQKNYFEEKIKRREEILERFENETNFQTKEMKRIHQLLDDTEIELEFNQQLLKEHQQK